MRSNSRTGSVLAVLATIQCAFAGPLARRHRFPMLRGVAYPAVLWNAMLVLAMPLGWVRVP